MPPNNVFSYRTVKDRKEKEMKRILILYGLVIIVVLSHVVLCHAEESEVTNTERLQRGDVVYDLNGEWNVTHKQYDENYGSLEWIGSYKEIVTVKQEGYKFVGTKVVDGELAGKEPETIRGELNKRGFIQGQIYRSDTGWRDYQGRITYDDKRIILSEGNVVKATLERK
jgi:hypothetical protein